ncbi:MAG: HYR domain-containing protein [Acidobacteria bacterium]|nr:HYR domain-containing protein [Acidobacteriota bacterium]
MVTVVDDDPPALNLPASFEVDASSPTGATVTYSASATDLVNGSVAVSCTPASGSFFATGATTVNCTSSDGSGNSANGSFTVTVLSASSQIANTIADIIAGVYGNQGGFTSTLQSASNALESGNTNAACGSLGAFENQVQAKIGKTLTAAQGAELIAAANQMQAAAGCN